MFKYRITDNNSVEIVHAFDNSMVHLIPSHELPEVITVIRQALDAIATQEREVQEALTRLRDAASRGSKIECIKSIRDLTHARNSNKAMSLRDAKNIVEAMLRI